MRFPAAPVPLVLAGLLSGCGASLDQMRVSSLNRVTTTRTEDGRQSVVKTPIQPALDGTDHGKSPDSSTGALEYLFNRTDDTGTGYAPDPAGTTLSPETAGFMGGPGLPLSLAAGYARTRIWTGLRTSFRSASFPAIAWNSAPRIGGTGAEASLLLFGRPNEENDPVFGEGVLNAGSFRRKYTSNSVQAGGFFVTESVDTRGGWLDAAMRIYLKRPVFMSLSAGLFYYRVRTAVNTNAPSFTYSGIDGALVFGALGFGAGLRTPWNFPLQAIIEGDLYLATGNHDPLLDSVAGQLKAGLAWSFY